MAKKIYQFKVTLKHIRPPIWRRIQVRDDLTFYQFHHVIQVSMGWGNAHLHQFNLGDRFFITDATTLYEVGFDGQDEQKARLKRFVQEEGQKIIYEYDFGDGWEHELLLEKVLPMEAAVTYPRCLKGKRACPPEDCGGPWGYDHLLEVLADEAHPEHEMYAEWVGEAFDPEAFDLAAVNEALAELRW